MPGNLGVMVLFQDPTVKVLVLKDNDLAAEIEQPTFDVPFGQPGGPGVLDLKEVLGCKSHGFFEVRVASEHLSDVLQEGDLWTSYHDALQHVDPEQGGTQERHIHVVWARSVIQTLGECIWFTHRVPRLVMKLEIEPGQIQRPLPLSQVEILRLPEVLQVLVVGPNLNWMLHTFEEVLLIRPTKCEG
jgi:hypothetical protein